MTLRFVLTIAVALPLLTACGSADNAVDETAGNGEPAAPMTDAQPPDAGDEMPGPGDDPAAETDPDPGADLPGVMDGIPDDQARLTGDSADEVEVSDVTGRWAADQDWCTDQTSGFPVTITRDRFEGRENICDIVELVDGGKSFTATLSCQAEGTTTTELVKMTPGDGTLTLTYLGRDDAETVLTRCLD